MHRESTIKRWTSIVDELMESCKSVEEFARERKISSGTLYKWRRSLLGPVRLRRSCRFFMSWAQVWRSKYTEKALRSQLVTDTHSPALFRVNGIVRNLDAWYEAFDVTESHALYLPPQKRIVIW